MQLLCLASHLRAPFSLLLSCNSHCCWSFAACLSYPVLFVILLSTLIVFLYVFIVTTFYICVMLLFTRPTMLNCEDRYFILIVFLSLFLLFFFFTCLPPFFLHPNQLFSVWLRHCCCFLLCLASIKVSFRVPKHRVLRLLPFHEFIRWFLLIIFFFFFLWPFSTICTVIGICVLVASLFGIWERGGGHFTLSLHLKEDNFLFLYFMLDELSFAFFFFCLSVATNCAIRQSWPL